MAKTPTLRPGKLFINGEWRESSDGQRRDVINFYRTDVGNEPLETGN